MIPLQKPQKGLLTFLFFILFHGITFTQTTGHQIVSAGGGFSETPQLSMSYTIGEISINTESNSFYIMTQGFQQSFPLTALQIELLGFFGEALSEGNALEWEAFSEINTDFFTLLRSADGRSFSEITTIKGAGTSTTLNDYQYLDINAPTGLSYYRLDQTDLDGRTTSSEIISLERLETYITENFNMRAYPNPAIDELTVKFDSAPEEAMQIQVYDLMGRMLQTHSIQVGQQKLHIDLANLPAGVYILSLQTASSQLILSTSRIVKSGTQGKYTLK